MSWQPSQEHMTKKLRTLVDLHREMDTTFTELAERTDVMLTLNAMALTIACRAHMTPDPPTALRDFKRMLTGAYEAVGEDIRNGKWTPPNKSKSTP